MYFDFAGAALRAIRGKGVCTFSDPESWDDAWSEMVFACFLQGLYAFVTCVLKWLAVQGGKLTGVLNDVEAVCTGCIVLEYDYTTIRLERCLYIDLMWFAKVS